MSTFDEKARDWDTPDRQARAEVVVAAIRDAIPLTTDMRAIDIGAGTGLLGIALAPHVGEVVLAVPSAGMLEVANDKPSAVDRTNVRAVRFDLVADPPPDGPFDLVVSLLVLHHLEDTAGALAAIARLLRPGGYLALADLDTEDGTFHDADAEGIHHHGFDRAHLGDLARAAGFTDVDFRTAVTIEDEGRRYPLFLLVGRRR